VAPFFGAPESVIKDAPDKQCVSKSAVKVIFEENGTGFTITVSNI
jgi:hypothetical protein